MSDKTRGLNKVYPRRVGGTFRNIRWAVTAVLLGVYFGLPWIDWAGRQAVLLDVPARKLYFFGLVIWPQEVYYIAILVLFLVMAFFFFTAVAGRLWCGYACPQTVFTDLFMVVEKFFEGDRAERMRLDSGGLTVRKAAEKTAKHAVWLVLSFAVAFAFVAYFVPSDELLRRVATLELTSANLFWLGLFTFATYGDCAFFRETMCLVPCPYGRFQSALFDSDTLIIGYDNSRGEPRGKKGSEGAGDCVDCTLCVQVCPTGIDIREGLQCECIACAQCIDACDGVMRKIGRPTGLIRYGSLRSIEGEKSKVLRPRLVVYAAILVISFAAFSWQVAQRVPLDMEVIRDRTALYQTSGDGRVSNLYTIKAMNRDTREHRYRIRVVGIGASMVIGENPVTVAPGEVYKTSLALMADEGADTADRKTIKRFRFVIEDVDEPGVRAERKSTFLFPEAPATARVVDN